MQSWVSFGSFPIWSLGAFLKGIFLWRNPRSFGRNWFFWKKSKDFSKKIQKEFEAIATNIQNKEKIKTRIFSPSESGEKQEKYGEEKLTKIEKL